MSPYNVCISVHMCRSSIYRRRPAYLCTLDTSAFTLQHVHNKATLCSKKKNIIKQHLYIISKFVFSQIQFLFNQYFLYKNIPPKQKHNFGICMVILEKTWVEIVRLQRCPFCKKFINLLKHALALLFLNILTPALGPKGPPRSNNAVCYSKLKILVIY